MSRKGRSIPEINAGSMADIAFLLLIFFLVTTSIDSDKGIAIKLPPKMPPDQELPTIKKRNIWEVLINKNDQLLVEGKWMDISQLCDATKEFIKNPTQNPDLSENPNKAVVSIKNDKGTSYGAYISVQNELKRAYNELRDEYSMQKFNRHYVDLPKSGKQEQEVLEAYPQKISEAEPEDQSGESAYK